MKFNYFRREPTTSTNDWRSNIAWPIKIAVKNTVEDINFAENVSTQASANLSEPEYRWTVSIETMPESFVNMIHSIRYRFDHSFNFAEKEILKRQSSDGKFKMSGVGSGEFTLNLDIKVRDSATASPTWVATLEERLYPYRPTTDIKTLKRSDFKQI